MSQPLPHHRWLFMGATGRVGRMIARVWRDMPPAAAILRQTRREGEGELFWDPLQGPLPPGSGRFDAMILFSGVTPATGSDMGLNVRVVEAGLTAAARADIGRVLVASSSAVYGTARRPCRESDPPAPVNAYGTAKARAEDACTAWRLRGQEICCLRIGNVAGADALLLNAPAATTERPARIDRFPGGGGPVRSYIGPATLARVLERLCRHATPLPDVLNIAAPRPIAMEDLADAAGMHWHWRPAGEGAQQRITLDTAALQRLHAFAPEDCRPATMAAQWRMVGGAG